MRALTVISALLILTSTSFAQVLVREKDAGKNGDEVPLSGPSSRVYGWWFVGYGFNVGAPEGTGVELIPGKTSCFTVGYRGQLRLAKWYHLGAQIAYFYDAYHLVQDSAKTFPTRELFDREKVIFNNLQFNPYMRFTFHRKRGNQMGKILDLGAYAGWTYRTKHQGHRKFASPNSVGGIKGDFLSRGLVYAEDINYGVNARMGIGHIVIFANYRLSDLFIKSYGYPELPRINVGIEVGLHE